MTKSLGQLQHSFSEYLENQNFNKNPQSLYNPVSYILSLGGKRLRPVLALMGCQLFGRRAEDALPAALAVEIFHNFSLLHDDIMDQAPLRRGKPTVHHLYGVNAGILSGDAMLIEAYRCLCESPADADLRHLLDIFNRMAIEVCEGQASDMDFEQRSDVSLPEYLRMIEQKTAALIGAALALGAVVAGASDQDVFHLDAFGRNIGIAFQIQDDLLDTFGDPEKFGKKTGGDIVQNKKTFLLLKAMEIADADTRLALDACFRQAGGDENSKIEGVKAIFKRLDIPELARRAKAQFQQAAFEHLHQLESPAERKAPLVEFSELLLVREV